MQISRVIWVWLLRNELNRCNWDNFWVNFFSNDCFMECLLVVSQISLVAYPLRPLIIFGGVCNFIGFVSPQQKKLKWQTSVTCRLQLSFIQQAKVHAPWSCEGGLTQKGVASIHLGFLFLYLLSPPSEPALCKLG